MRNTKNRVFKVLAALVLFALLLANSKNITSPLRARIVDSSSPVLKFAHEFFRFSGKIIPFSSLREDNRILRERIDSLNRKLDESKVVYDENARLKDLLNFRRSIPYTTMPAQVIGRDPTNWSNSIIIDKGSLGGIRQNKAVISTRGLVGRVVEAGRYSAKILLITDINSKVGVLIQRSRQGGILVGRPDGKCKMIYIAMDSDAGPGDRIITAGLGGIFPKDVLVGKIIKVGKEPGRLYRYAIVETSQDMSRLEEVLCIR